MTRRHLFVCANSRYSGKPACGLNGGAALLAAVQNLLIARGSDARVTACGCLGPCFDGPNAVIYPDGIWYAHLTEADAPALVRHLVDGEPLVGKQCEPPGE